MGDADISDVLGLKASTSLTIRRRRVYLAIKCGKCTWQLLSTLTLSAFSYLDRKYFIRWTICLNAVYHAEIEIRLLHGEFSQELLSFLTEKTYWKFDLDRIDPYMEILSRKCFPFREPTSGHGTGPVCERSSDAVISGCLIVLP